MVQFNSAPNILQALSGFASGNTVGDQFANVNSIMANQQANAKKTSEQTALENTTFQYLQSRAPELAQAVQNKWIEPKAAFAQYLQQRQEAQAAAKPKWTVQNINGRLVRVDPNTGQTQELGNYAAPEKATDDQREYQMAKDQGFAGSFMDYQVKMKEAGRNQVNIDTGEKLPSGYRWKDPNKREAGVEPIPGGPGEQLPAELAARIGMADSFQKNLPAIKEKVQAGDVTGPIDVARGATMGTNETYLQIQSGVDALQRLLTGAGMNVAEAEQYARRYLPGYFDNPETTLAKLDRLSNEIESAKAMALKGRGGQPDKPQDTLADPLGIR